MIHQLIFAHPKPGMTEQEFGEYWLGTHAPQFAAKIPQIARYRIDLREPELDGADDPLWCGVAEIWLRNDEEQLASMQTPEFLDGARRDEPNWAAFWRTVVLDTDAHPIVEREPGAQDTAGVTVFTLVKRRAGLGLEQFRARSLGAHAELVAQVPNLRTYTQGHCRDGLYAVGEATLDAAFQASFDDVDACREALASVEWKAATEDLAEFTEARYVHQLVVSEHWVIGPEAR